ncbi:MAG TPA: type VI secretion system lipoprotein TssJ [Polyangiaceae bacterium]|nr:type VI secretion system lipoprotein TssJ [Polyangiaceae bacterium]
MERVSIAVALAAALSACGSGAPPPPAAAPKPCEPVQPTLAITASDRSNASSAEPGRPVQVRVYQLKNDAKLRTASFEEIWQNDAAVLEGDLVSLEEHTVFPGQTTTVPVSPKAEATTLALVALFREPQGKDWFITYELAPPRNEPPCPNKDVQIPVFLDRMQIQDGTGR